MCALKASTRKGKAMFIHASKVHDRAAVRAALKRAGDAAEVWQADSCALLIGETPDDEDGWRYIGTAAEYLRDIPTSEEL